MVRLKSFAKINLGLEIVGRREDGYHELKTIFQTVALFDTIEMTENRSGKINLQGDYPGVEWDERNTISRAFAAVRKNFAVNQGFDVRVNKRIPPGSGLGGGSSNAAVVLLFLNEYFKLGLGLEELTRIGVGIGADVPFFLAGGTVLRERIGDRITILDDLEDCVIGIVVPDIKVSTGLIFSNLTLTTKPFASKIDTFMKSRDFSLLENNLEEVTFKLFPEVRAIKEKMMKCLDCGLALMSGSGSAVYCVARQEDIVELKSLFAGSSSFVVRTMNRKDYFKSIGASPSGKAPAFGAGIRRFESFRPRE